MDSHRKMTAKQTYASRSGDVQELMRLLQHSLEQHIDPGEEINWAHAGDLAHVRARLVELVAQVGCVAEATVCEELNMD